MYDKTVLFSEYYVCMFNLNIYNTFSILIALQHNDPYSKFLF